MPWGIKMMKRMRTIPITMGYCLKWKLINSLKNVKRHVPKTGPMSVPAPPTMVQTTTSTEVVQWRSLLLE
jgi:hypothetical protein